MCPLQAIPVLCNLMVRAVGVPDLGGQPRVEVATVDLGAYE